MNRMASMAVQMETRAVGTYRAGRRNAARGIRRSLLCKAERKARGEARSEFDRRRRREQVAQHSSPTQPD